MKSTTVLERISFPVEGQEIRTVKGVKIPDRLAIVRTDTNQTLSIVSKRYKIIPHDQIMEKPLEAIVAQGFELKSVYLKRGGQAVVIEAHSTEKYQVGTDKDIFQRLLLINSYDLSSTATVLQGAYRQVCSNGAVAPFFLPSSFNNIVDKRHIGNVQEEVKHWDFSHVREEFQSTLKFYQKLSDTQVSDEVAKVIFSKMEFSTKLQDKILNLWERGDGHTGKRSAWFLLNSLTQYQRDRQNTLTEDRVGARVISNVEVQQKFFHLLNTHLDLN